MPNFETIFTRLIRHPKLFTTLIVGGLLCFIPILHFFAFGFLARFTRNLHSTGNLIFPEWGDLPELFNEGIRLTLIATAFVLLPVLIGFGVKTILLPVGMDALLKVVLAIITVIAVAIFASAYYRYQTGYDYRKLFNLKLILNMSRLLFPSQLILFFSCYGIYHLLMPLYGFAIFTTLFLALTQTTAYFYHLDVRGSRDAS